MKNLTVVLAALGPALLSLPADATEGHVTRQDNALYLDGREYRASATYPDVVKRIAIINREHTATGGAFAP